MPALGHRGHGPDRGLGRDDRLARVSLVPPAAPPDLSFARYVARRKAEAATRARESALYAYGPDLRFRAAVRRLRPVMLAIQAAERRFLTIDRDRLVRDAVPLLNERFARAYTLLVRAAARLGLAPPRTLVSDSPLNADLTVLGTSEDPLVLLPRALLEALEEAELAFVLGDACGRIQNEHPALLTALHYVEHAETTALRWAGRPAARALGVWAMHAAITGDRAGLLVARDLQAARRALEKRARALGCERSPLIELRQEALGLFARTAYYRGGLDRTTEGGEDATVPSAPDLTLAACEVQTHALFSKRGPR